MSPPSCAESGPIPNAIAAVAAVPAWTLGQAAPAAAPPADPQVQAIEEQIKALSQKLEAVKAAKKAEGLGISAEVVDLPFYRRDG